MEVVSLEGYQGGGVLKKSKIYFSSTFTSNFCFTPAEIEEKRDEYNDDGDVAAMGDGDLLWTADTDEPLHGHCHGGVHRDGEADLGKREDEGDEVGKDVDVILVR